MQHAAERILELRGYVRLTQANLCLGQARRGWFGHMPNQHAIGNMILLDLLILSNRPPYRYLLVELKTPTGRLAKHQAAFLTSCKSAILIRNLEDLPRILTAWENEA
jgi:hypothetical protein